jgi:hypothetical protein
MRNDSNTVIAAFEKQAVTRTGVSRALLMEIAVFSMYKALNSLEKQERDTALAIGKLAVEAITCSAVH